MSLKDSLNLKAGSIVELPTQGTATTDLTLDKSQDILTASVTGIVYDTTLLTGTPVQDAIVTVFDATGNIVTYARTNALGIYLITNLTDNTPYTISATKSGYSVSETQSFTANSLLVTTENLVITPSTTNLSIIYGTVKNTDGTALANANVILKDTTTGNIFSQTVTIDDGEYVLYNVPAATYSILVNADGYYPSLVDNVQVAASENELQDISLNADPNTTTGVITGIITDSESQPVENAFVGLYSIDTSNAAETLVSYVYTNAQGRYMFSNVAAASYIVKAKLSIE